MREADVAAAWRKIFEFADGLVQQRQLGPLWPVVPGTELAEDDRMGDPWPTSDAASVALGVALDHLHALAYMVLEGDVVHAYAPFTVARGCLENSAIALWILAPERREDRILRALSWYATDFRDLARASATAGFDISAAMPEKLTSLSDTAGRVGGDPVRALKNVPTSDVLRYVDRQMQDEDVRATFLWQLCSGFAHGRPWPSLVGLVELDAEDDFGASSSRRRGSLDRLLHPAVAGVQVLRRAMGTHADLSSRYV